MRREVLAQAGCLKLQASVLLLAQLELHFDDFLLPPQVRDHPAQIGKLLVHVAGGLGLRRRRRACILTLPDVGSLRTDRVQVLMEHLVLLRQLLRPRIRNLEPYRARDQQE